jgi:hypothetical protein
VKHYEETGDVDDLDWLQERGMKALTNSFWRLPRVRPEAIWKPDLLHNIYLGLVKHSTEWVQGFLDKHNQLDEFDRVWKLIPPFPGIAIPKKAYREIIQWQGKEMLNLGQFLLAALTVAFSRPITSQRPTFTKALACIQALIDFHLMAQYRSHTEQTFGYMESFLKSFHQHIDIFLEFCKSKTAKSKMRQANKTLLAAQALSMPASENTSKRRKVVADWLERSEQRQDIY